MKRRAGLSSRPIEFMPRRFFFVVTREVASCAMGSSTGQRAQQCSGACLPSSSVSSAFFPRTPGIQFISLHDQLSQSTTQQEGLHLNSDAEEEFNIGILQTLQFNSFLTQLLTSRSSVVTNEHQSSSGGIHQYNPHYFFVRREKLTEVTKAVHLICRWRLMYLGLSPQEALAPFEHLPFLFTSFFAPCTRFKPPNLLESLMGIAKGISSDLLVHTDLESLGLVRPFGGAVDQDESMESETHVEHLELRILAPVSRRFFIAGNPNRRRQRSHEHGVDAVGEKKVSDSPSLSLPSEVTEANKKNETQHFELLASQLTRSKVSLTIVVDGDQDCSSFNISELFVSKGLRLLDLSSHSSTESAIDDTSECGTVSRPSIRTASSEMDEQFVSRFLDACEQTPGTIAVSSLHISSQTSSPSLSYVSAATCIGCYLMKHHNFTSQEAVGWIRYCRPEYISQTHQLFLDHMQSRMWHEGELFRRRLQERKQSEAADRSMMENNGRSINIGHISLGRESLLGTKFADEISGDDSDPLRPRSRSRSSRHHRSHLSIHQHLQSSQLNGVNSDSSDEHGSNSLDELQLDRIGTPIGASGLSSSATPKQRRPLTQGNAISARRLHRSSDGSGFARADFALLHKFVHQTTAPYSCSSEGSGFRGSTASRSSGSSSSGSSSSGLAVGSAMAAAVARASTSENPTLARRTADVST